MQLVIDLPDAIYEALYDIYKRLDEKDISINADTLMGVVYPAIYNGIRLPKGHGALIDRSNLLSKGKCCCRIEFCSGSCETCSDNCVEVGDIESASIIIPADIEKANINNTKAGGTK